MGRFLAGVAATLVLVSAGLFLWNARADRASPIPAAPQAIASRGEDKFAAADKDKNGQLGAVEFASTRVVRKAKPKRDCPPTRQAPAEEES